MVVWQSYAGIRTKWTEKRCLSSVLTQMPHGLKFELTAQKRKYTRFNPKKHLTLKLQLSSTKHKTVNKHD